MLTSSPATLDKINTCLTFISDRASEKLWTSAKSQRGFVLRHLEFRRDNKAEEVVCYDLLMAVKRIRDCNSDCNEAVRFMRERWRRRVLF